jgi:predicted metalloprotease with PDZ domain
VPLGGIERAGYKLVFKDEPNPYDKARMAYTKSLSLFNSLGVTLDKEGKVTATRWGSPAFKAGLVSGMQVMWVDRPMMPTRSRPRSPPPRPAMPPRAIRSNCSPSGATAM